MIKKISLITFILCLVLIVLNPVTGPVSGQNQSQITVSNNSAQMDFPLNLNFSVQIHSNVNITDVRLRYQVEQISFAQVISETFIAVKPGTNIIAKYTLDMRKVGGMPPGAYLNYWWMIKDASGATLETSPVRFQVTDNRYNWQNLTEGKINLFWYQGNNTFAQALMSSAQQALVKLASDTGATPEKTINIYIYNGSQDLQGSMIYPNEWTGGVAFTQYNVIAIGISPSNLAWGQGAMTHELTHNVIYQVIFNPYNDLPVWLNEGLAMYAEGPLSSQFTTPLIEAIKTDRLLSVRSISSPFSAFADKANLSYAQSYSLVDYLIQEYGAAKMQELLNTFKQGSTYDGAFQKVYGFDMDGLNGQWQTWAKNKYGK